jgi:glyoxylase-like metal-dependent hydrolase (beta-lactamase superfamily II)
MKLTQAGQRIFYIPNEKASDRPYLYYLKGDRCSAAIDAGNSAAHVQLFYDAIRDAGFPLPAYTLITHWHWDHTFGIPYVSGTVISSEKTRQKLLEVSRWQWTDDAMKQREQNGEDIAFCNDCIHVEYPDLAKIRVEPSDTGLTEEKELDLGNLHVQLIPMDSVHSRDALLMYVPEEKALFVGDADCEDFYDNHGLADPQRLDAYLKRIREIPFESYYIGHDVPETRAQVMTRLEELQNSLNS